jgi:transposase
MHLMTSRTGVPLAVTVSQANQHDLRQLLPLVFQEFPTIGGQPLGRLRWPIERTLSWLKQFRRLRIRWERLVHLYEAFLLLGCCPIAWRHLSSR